LRDEARRDQPVRRCVAHRCHRGESEGNERRGRQAVFAGESPGEPDRTEEHYRQCRDRERVHRDQEIHLPRHAGALREHVAS
jgi:hypothetical protein